MLKANKKKKKSGNTHNTVIKETKVLLSWIFFLIKWIKDQNSLNKAEHNASSWTVLN